MNLLRAIAQAAAPESAAVPDNVKPRILAAVLLTSLLGLIGIVMIILLLRSWRRYNDRLRAERSVTDSNDIWSTAAQRMAAASSSDSADTVDYDDTDVSQDDEDDDDEPEDDDNGDVKHG